MERNPQTTGKLRPVDLARRHGLSTQAVRNYEDAGSLPPAARTAHGYRVYTPVHAAALRAFLALVPGHGHRAATSIMRAVNEGATEEAFRLVDEGHAQLLDDRRTLRAVERALRDLGPVATLRARRHVHRAAGAPARAAARHAAHVGAGRASSSRAVTRGPATASTTTPTSGTSGWPTSSAGAATCWSRSLR